MWRPPAEGAAPAGAPPQAGSPAAAPSHGPSAGPWHGGAPSRGVAPGGAWGQPDFGGDDPNRPSWGVPATGGPRDAGTGGFPGPDLSRLGEGLPAYRPESPRRRSPAFGLLALALAVLGLALVAVVPGLVPVTIGLVLAAGAVVVGVLALRRSPRPLGIAAIALGGLAVLLAIATYAVVALV